MCLGINVNRKLICKYDYLISLTGFMQFQMVFAMISKSEIGRHTSELQ